MSGYVTVPDESSSASLVARWVLMLSHLYYDRSTSLVDDATYDELCRMVAARWDELDEHLQDMLGSAEEIVTTGSHVLVSRWTISAAERLAAELGYALEPHRPTFTYEYEDERGAFELAPIRG